MVVGKALDEGAGRIAVGQIGDQFFKGGFHELKLQRAMRREQMTKLTFQVSGDQNKFRLDNFLFDAVPDLSKMYLRELIKSGGCEVNGAFENSGFKLRENDFIELEADLTRGTAMRPEDLGVNVVFEDKEVIVVNKPSGMLVHPTHRDKNGTLLNALSFYLNARNETSNAPTRFLRPGLVHRLDKHTSGLMVVAKTSSAHRVLSDHFKRKLVRKRYYALVEGVITEPKGVICERIGRFAEQKRWGVKPDGKYSESRFWTTERFADTTLLELEPVTGRTNQLRIHCATSGHPIVGDTMRGGRPFERLCLHASKLSFNHPRSGEAMHFELPIPAEFNLSERSR
jgi:23S rRNA pseudouridine1911/1915/1917 synthase